ncbi:hypothetical protein M2311_006853, partial [Rhizobium leguminosarum]|nr:hypothetical protein [Rhizobium leguminosarum]
AALSSMREHVPHEVNPAPLPSGIENLGNGSLETFVRIRDNQLHPA